MRTCVVQSWASVLFVGLLLGSFSGCGGDDTPVREYADVAGKVTYNGEALKRGKVMFQPPNGSIIVGEIQPDGTYTLKGVVGPNDVTIIARDEVPTAGPDEPISRVEPKNDIPPEYGTPDSGLKFEVKPGTNTADFDLQ
ncbi:MAG: hypothetical protein WEB58_10880 [Planctomycetaceae bacterium]